MSELPLPDPLEEFLDHPPARPDPAELRKGLLRRTTAIVRRRRLARRFVAATAVAALLALVVGGVWLAYQRGPEKLPDDTPAVHARVKSGPGPEDEPQAKAGPPQHPQPPLTGLALEWKAFDAPREERSALYFQAGDRYLEEERDLASAVRCYGRAVQMASAQSLQIQGNDNWLVTALKQDRIEREREN
jgi:hypothetical protein